MTALLVVVMFGALFTIPLGLPGLWIMVGAVAVGAVMREVGIVVLAATVAIALFAELVEFMILKRKTAQYGGSRKAFWGALAGGLVGVLVGVPIPIVGSIVAGTIGSFLGAALVTYGETRELRTAHRVGFGVVVARVMSAVVKAAAGVVILVLGAAALLT